MSRIKRKCTEKFALLDLIIFAFDVEDDDRPNDAESSLVITVSRLWLSLFEP